MSIWWTHFFFFSTNSDILSCHVIYIGERNWLVIQVRKLLAILEFFIPTHNNQSLNALVLFLNQLLNCSSFPQTHTQSLLSSWSYRFSVDQYLVSRSQRYIFLYLSYVHNWEDIRFLRYILKSKLSCSAVH